MINYPFISLENLNVQVFDCDHRTPKFQPSGYPYITIPNIVDGQLNLSETRYISREDYIEWTKRTKPQVNDIILTRRARVGDIAVVPPDFEFALGQNLVIVRSKNPNVSQEYLRWALRGPLYRQEVQKFLNVGAVFDSLNVTDIPKIRIPLPPLDEQREIARILGALDDKIDLNRRMNATLEATARALFQSWFVDFDPVHAKAEGRDPDGMDSATAALFPDSFEESALGMIPRGWGVKSLDRIADFQNGLALQKFPPEGDTFLPVIKIRELRQGYIDGNSDKASPNIRESCIVYDGDVLFSWSGSLLVDVWCGGMGALNQHLFKVTSTEYAKWFYLQWTQHHLEEFIGVAADKATTMGHIQRQHLSSALTVIPPGDVLAQLDGFISPLLEQMIQIRLESRTLAEMRDALLPKLISGEVRTSP